MKKKILSVLLAVMMIVGLLPLAQLFANATEPAPASIEDEYDIIYYVKQGGTNSSTAGKTRENPASGIGRAYKNIVALKPAEDAKIAIVLLGDVVASASAKSNGFFSDLSATDKTISTPVYVISDGYVKGQENTKKTISFAIGDLANSSSRKTIFGSFFFKDVIIAADHAAAAETAIIDGGYECANVLLAAGIEGIGFDNVTFKQTDFDNENVQIGWLISADATTPTVYQNNYEYNNISVAKGTVKAGQTKTQTFNFAYTPSVTFRNGDYTYLKEVSAALAYVGGTNNEKVYKDSLAAANRASVTKYYNESDVSDKTVTSSNYYYKKVHSVSVSIILEEGAVMKTVSAFNWNYTFGYMDVIVKAGATVENLYGAGPSALNFTNTHPANIVIEEGADVEKALCYADTVDYASYKNAAGEAASAIDPAKIKADIRLTDYNNRELYYKGELISDSNFAIHTYVSASGSDSNSGLAEDAAYLSFTNASNFIAKFGKGAPAMAYVHVYGAVAERASAGNAFFIGTAAINMNVTVLGEDEDASIAMWTESATHASTRKNAVNHFTIKDIKFTLAPKAGTTAPSIMTIGTMCDMVLDNVTFDDALTDAGGNQVKWAISADANAGTYMAPFHTGATKDNILTLSSSLTLKNGDYSGAHLILAAGGSHNSSLNVDSDAVAGVTDYRNSNRWFNYTSTLNIGEGAIVDKVAGQSWSVKFPEIVDYRVVINALPGSTVNTINGTTDQWKVDSTADIYINVDPSVTNVAEDDAPVINAYGTAEHVYHHGSVIIGEGFESKGASLVIDSKVGALVLFDKAVIADPSNVAYSVCNDPTTGATTTFSAPVATGTELITCEIGGVEYYAIRVPGIAPENFDDTYVTVTGFGFPQIVFTMDELAEKASDAWAGDATWAPVAEAVTNLGIAANGGTPEFTTEPDLDRSAKVALSTGSDADVLTGYSLHIDNAVGITLQFADGVTVTANGTELEDGVNAKMTATTATVFVNAKSLRHGFTFVATDEQGNEAELVVSVWQIAQVYANITDNDDVTDAHKAQAKAVLAYIEALDGINA